LEGRVKKFLSRKFLLAVGAIVAEILIGIGYNIDPELIAQLAVAIAGLYVIVEGVIDAIKKPDS